MKKLLLAAILLSVAALAQTPTQIQDTTFFAFGNPPLKANCQLAITAPTTISGSNFYWGNTLFYNVMYGVVNLYAQPGTQPYVVTGNCYQGSGGQINSYPVNMNWCVPVSGGPVTVAQLTATCNNSGIGNNGVLGFTQTIAHGTATMATGAIASGSCTSAVTVTAAGVLSTDVLDAGFNGDPTSTTGYIPSTSGVLYIAFWPTAGAVNFKVCNITASPITPGALTLNWHVTR